MGYDKVVKPTYHTAVDLRVRLRPGDEGDRAPRGDARVGGEDITVLLGQQAAVVHREVDGRASEHRRGL